MRIKDFFKYGTPTAILGVGQLGTIHAKTTYGLLRHSKVLKPVCVIAEQAGKNIEEFVKPIRYKVPIVKDINSAISLGAKVLTLGVSNPGGVLDKKLKPYIKEAIERGMDILSGLHVKISQIEEFKELATRKGVRIIDLRIPPKDLKVLKGDLYKRKSKVICILGTDCVVGKRTTTVQLWERALKRGLKAGFIATGQTGIMIGADEGVVLDAVPSDFVSGVMENMVLKLDKEGKEYIFVEGQGALLHPAYGQVTLGIIHGSKPDFIVMVHDPDRKRFDSFPHIPFKPCIEKEIELAETFSRGGKVIVVAVIGKKCEKMLNLPVIDPFDERDLDVVINKILGREEQNGI